MNLYNVDNCPKIQENWKTIRKSGKTVKIWGNKKIYSSPLPLWKLDGKIEKDMLKCIKWIYATVLQGWFLNRKNLNLRFESSVNSEGIETIKPWVQNTSVFESSVNFWEYWNPGYIDTDIVHEVLKVMFLLDTLILLQKRNGFLIFWVFFLSCLSGWLWKWVLWIKSRKLKKR